MRELQKIDVDEVVEFVLGGFGVMLVELVDAAEDGLVLNQFVMLNEDEEADGVNACVCSPTTAFRVAYGPPLYVCAALHLPSSPAGPASTGTGSPLLWMSAMVTNHERSLGSSVGMMEAPEVIFTCPPYVVGVLHFPSDPAGPPAMVTGRPFRSISAIVTHHGVPLRIVVGAGPEDRELTYTMVVMAVVSSF